MRGSRRGRGPVALLAFVLALSACGSSVVPSVAPTSASPGASVASSSSSAPASSSTGPAPSAPAVDFADLSGSMAAAEIAARADDRARIGLAKLGPGATDLAAAMDASAARALAKLRADAAGPKAATGNEIAAVGLFADSVPAPGFQSMLVWGDLDHLAR